MDVGQIPTTQAPLRRRLIRRVEVLRLLFGVVWAIDAYLKWQPSFIRGYSGDVASAGQGQPDWIRPWFRFWRHLVAHDPRLFAYATALTETLIALFLVVGFARRTLYVAGAVWSLGIWIVPEGFGGSFLAGATDIGTAVMYVLIFATLYSLEALPAGTGAWSLDRFVERRVRWWAFLAEPGGHVPAPEP
jgi:thiosulfate dehydrogenase (quinone) large subunit